jgi:DNA-binding response OmpR family regulator
LRLQEHGAVLLPKPFTGDELLSAISKAMSMRAAERQAQSQPPPDAGRALHHSSIAVDLLSQTVRVEGALVDLQPTQFRLLATLLANVGRALTVEELVETSLRGTHQNGAVNIRFQIHTLRRRLGAAGALIETAPPGYGIAVGKT